MFANRIVQVDTKEIQVTREIRQRTDLTPDSVLDLACTIGRNQWIAPILIDQDTNHIVAGERRLTAVRVLAAAVNGVFSGFTNPEEAKAQLYPVCSCKVDSWKQWTRIPAQLGTNLTERDLSVYEFIENAHRQDLPWQDKAKAIYAIHAHGLREDPEWNNTKTGQLAGMQHSWVAKNLRVWRVMEDSPSPELKHIIQESPTLNAALQALARHTSRRADSVVSLSTPKAKPPPNSTDISAKPGPKTNDWPLKQPGEASILDLDDDLFDEDPDVLNLIDPDRTLGEDILVCADFHEWAKAYAMADSLPPFNFIHCDFPYGLNFNTGDQTSGVDAKLTGDYDDSPEVYWSLLDTLVRYRHSLIAESAHIMFWFSQNLRRETEDFFRDSFPDATVQDFLMIWHSSDMDGTVPDPQRYGRRTYETAMLLTFGDRLIVGPKALSFAASRESRTRIHRSQKPLSVLEHFLSMFVDDASSFLDPTAGSGTSCLAAHNLGATQIIGIEKDPTTYQDAVRHINQMSDINL